ncbi:MAG: phenylalanine--tRNA ligase subunit alpha [Candidatus Dormibacteria bacterium]
MSDIQTVANAALDEVAAAGDIRALESVRTRYLGRGDGLLSSFRRQIGTITDPEAKRALGQRVNALVERVQGVIDERRAILLAAGAEEAAAAEAMDLTWPPPPLRRGHLHPVTIVIRDVRRIFGHLGYISVGGPEVEYDRYNFTLVNMPPGHPSRDTQDTFFIDSARLLRTHTSPVQIRSMIQRGAPQRVIVPGKAYRRDYDATHFPMFFQVEGMCIDEGISLADLKGTLEFYARAVFGPDRPLRMRPHHFEFTEPSVELDVTCGVCGGEGCRLCKHTGWLELLGGGMIHPAVLRNGGIDTERYTGFAFGMGVERLAILAYGIEDGRLLYENDVRFLEQA